MPRHHDTAVLYLRGFPRSLKDSFKSECYKRGSDMKTVVRDFMRDYIKKAQEGPELYPTKKGRKR